MTTYAVHADIVNSASLRQRVTACAAQEGAPNPPQWVNANIWTLPAADWRAAWASMEAAEPGADHGANEAGITDAMILAVVQPLLTP
jgi:hypothetical protein